MGTFRGTREQYDKMLAAYRERPGEHAYAARAAGVEVRSARRGWRGHWTSPPWARCFQTVIEEDQAAARAKLAREEAARAAVAPEIREVRKVAEFDAVAEKVREAEACRASMSAAIAGLAVTGTMSKARVALARRVSEELLAATIKGDVSWERALGILSKLQWLDAQAGSQLKNAMEVLRLHIGEPDKFIRVSGEAAARATDVDGAGAVEALGGEANLRQAVIDLAEGRMTPLVERLIEYQLQQTAARAAGNA